MTGQRWVRLDGSFPFNHKIVELAQQNRHRAITLYVSGLAYAGSQDTDGHIPAVALRILHGRPADAHHLVEAGLWEPNGTGWNIHDWHHYQPQQDTYTERSQRARDAANIRWHGTPTPP